MVGVFRRSLSLPVPNPNPNSSTKEKSYHVRSVSLPCRSHPLISHLQHEIQTLRSWQADASQCAASPAHLRTGLTLLEQLHVGLDELLQLPKTLDSLRLHRSSQWASTLLDGYLRLADAFGCFREGLVSLQQLHSEAQVAVRRRDEKAVAATARSHRKVEREIAKTAVTLRGLGKTQEATLVCSGHAELVGILREVKAVVASTSALVLTGFAAFSTSCFSESCSSSSFSMNSRWTVLKRRYKTSESKEEDWKKRIEGLRALEECNVGLEEESGRVFRCLVNTRVSLLNILTP